jgi:hypothetical protein
MRLILRGAQVLLLLMGAELTPLADAAEPGKVTIGAYVNQILDLSFKDRRYSIDFWVWFRWKPEGEMADYKPLESFEIINGRIESRSSIVEKKIGDVNYISARITASISQPWDLDAFPLDNHRLRIYLEDSKLVASQMVFDFDAANSGLGDEINLSGWTVSFFDAAVTTKVYKSNFGDVSLPTKDRSEFSRFTFSMDLRRENHEAAIKLLTTMLVAPLVAFAAFLIKPTDVNTRFGVGVGALFAVATSAVIVAAAVPDSTALTAADRMHMIAMSFIFASLVQSAICMKWEATGHELRCRWLDRVCLVAFPLLFVLMCGRVVLRAMQSD